MNFLLILIFLIVSHAIYNLINYFRFPIIENNFFCAYSQSDRQKAILHQNQILNYIKFAGVKDRYVVIAQPIGYGKLASSKVSVFDNILTTREEIASQSINCLYEARANYWNRFINSFNPFYWLRIVIFIPKYILSYLGVSEGSIIIKIFQLIYWLLAIIGTFLINIFPEEIKTITLKILNIS